MHTFRNKGVTKDKELSPEAFARKMARKAHPDMSKSEIDALVAKQLWKMKLARRAFYKRERLAYVPHNRS